MLVYNAIYGQSLFDICLQTYGSLDYLLKLLQDNGISDINQTPSSRQPFTWDETLVTGQVSRVYSSILATAVTKNGNVLSVVQAQGAGGGVPYVPTYQPATPIYVTKYQVTLSAYYVSGGGETSFTLTELIGADIVEVVRETQTLKPSEFGFNSNTGTISGLSPSLNQFDTVYITYTKMITS